MPLSTTPAPIPAPASTAGADELAATRLALAQTTAQLRQIEESATRSATDAALATALSAVPDLHPHVVGQLTELLRPEVSVYRNTDGSLKPMGPGITPIGEFVAERLKQPEFSHFRKGGGGSAAGAPGPFANVPLLPAGSGSPQDAPRSLGEAVIGHMLANRAQKTTDPRLDMSQSFGLGRFPRPR